MKPSPEEKLASAAKQLAREYRERADPLKLFKGINETSISIALKELDCPAKVKARAKPFIGGGE